MQTLFQSQGHIDVIKPTDLVHVMKSHDCIEEIRFIDIKNYQFSNISTDPSNSDPNSFRQIRIACSRISDDTSMINFVPMVY